MVIITGKEPEIMGVAERKQREKDKRRDAIINAAERVFIRKGLDESSMELIAGEAELSKGTLYLYFKSKDELYRSILYRAFRHLGNLLEKSLSPHKTGFENLLELSNAYIGFSENHEHYFNAILHFENDISGEKGSVNKSVKSHGEGDKVIKILIDVLRKGMEDGSLRGNIRPAEYAFVLWSQLTGLLQIINRKIRTISRNHGIEKVQLLESFIEMMGYALKS